MVPCPSMTCACLYHGPSHLPVSWSCPLAHSLGLLCLRGLPLWVWLGLFGSLPPWFPFLRCWLLFRWAVCTFGVVWAPWPQDAMESFVPVGPLLRSSWRAFGVGCCGCCCGCPPRSALSIWGAVQIKVRTDLVLAAGVLSLRHRKSATERIPSLLTGLVRLVLDPVLRASSGSLAQGSAGSAWFVEPPKWSIAPSTFSFYSQVIIYSFETSGDLQHFYSTVYPSSAPRIATMLVEQRSTENMPH